MEQWRRILEKVSRHGELRNDRTGVGTLALFGEQLVFDNRAEFPAVTLKKLGFDQVKAELACFLQGYDNLEGFHKMGCTIWDGNGGSEYWKPFARSEGDLGRIYGVQWRDWKSCNGDPANSAALEYVKHTDQLKNLVDGMRKEPHGRRHMVTAWNPGELSAMCLPPCHLFFQAFINKHSQVDLAVVMRSVDLFLGLPFDVASYALLQRLLAKELGLDSGMLTFFLGDAHIYLNHREQVAEVLQRTEKELPTLALAADASLFEFHPSQALLQGYEPHAFVKAPLNV